MPIENALKMVITEATSLDGYSTATVPTPLAIPVTGAQGTLPSGFIPGWNTKEDTSNKGQANGYAALDADGTVPLAQLPATVKEAQVVADIDARDAITDPFAGLHVLVLDATDDETVETGGAEYIYTGTEFVKVAELNDLDMVLEWDNITDRPESTVAEIDAAVEDAHTHSNLTSLAFIGADEEDLPTWNNAPWPHPAAELPAIDEETDAGKVLAVNIEGTAVEWIMMEAAEPPDPELPEIGEGDAGKVLTVNDDEDAVEWVALPVVQMPDPELPEIGEGDAGKVLQITGDETGVEWGTPFALPSFDPETDGGKVLAIKADGSGVEWVTSPAPEE